MARWLPIFKNLDKEVKKEMPDPYKLEIIDQDERIIKAWATVEVKDSQGDIIPIEEVAKIMPIIMDRGGLVMYKHSNKPVGKILGWEIREHPETGKPGLLLTIKIFDHYSIDDEVWEKIKKGIIKGISFGGIAKGAEWTKDEEGNPVRVLRDIEGLEFSLVEEPANPYAKIIAINELAKGDNNYPKLFDIISLQEYGKRYAELDENLKKEVLIKLEGYVSEWFNYIEKDIEKSLLEDGKDIEVLKDMLAWIVFGKTSDKLEKEKVEKITNIAIEIRKAVIEKIKTVKPGDEISEYIDGKLENELKNTLANLLFGKSYDRLECQGSKIVVDKIAQYFIEKYIEFKKPEDLRPPKEWWEHCTKRIREQGYSEESARRLCGWVYYHHLKPESQEGDKPYTRQARRRKRKWLEETGGS